MGETGPADFLQCRLDAHRRIEDRRRCANDGRWDGCALAEQVTPVRLAARLDLDWCHFEQSHGDLVKSGGPTATELELYLADRLAPVAASRANFTLVDCRFYSR